MGKSSRRKGYRGEWRLVRKLKAAGFEARRVPLSGQTEFAKGDVVIYTGEKSTERYIAEVKTRKEDF